MNKQKPLLKQNLSRQRKVRLRTLQLRATHLRKVKPQETTKWIRLINKRPLVMAMNKMETKNRTVQSMVQIKPSQADTRNPILLRSLTSMLRNLSDL